MYTFNELLLEIAKGKRQVTIQFPEIKAIQAVITEIDLTRQDWKPFKVRILTKGLSVRDTRYVTNDFIGEVLEEYNRPYTEDWIMTQFITNIDFEDNKQIEISF
jgi:hypothetical protein